MIPFPNGFIETTPNLSGFQGDRNLPEVQIMFFIGMATGSKSITRVPVLNWKRVPVLKAGTRFEHHFLCEKSQNCAPKTLEMTCIFVK